MKPLYCGQLTQMCSYAKVFYFCDAAGASQQYLLSETFRDGYLCISC